MKKIAIEEHFVTKEYSDYFLSLLAKEPLQEITQDEKVELEQSWFRGSDTIKNKLLDVGEGRLREMDEAGIDMQVLSLVTSAQVLSASTGTAMAKKLNDKLSEIVKEHPKRFAGLATIAPQSPKEAADELQRAVRDLGLKGAFITSHVKGEYLDDRKYWAIFETAEKLDVPIYLHPRAPSPVMVKPYLTYPVLARAMHGYAAEVSLHALRLICSGLFDEFPKLNIILGHLGEALPYWMWRMDNHWLRSPLAKKLKRTPSEYIKDNFYISTSGMFWLPPLICAYLALGADRILFAVDHPFESNKEGASFIESLPICDVDKEKICHLNTERLFKL